MTPEAYMIAARVPRSIQPQNFGPWSITRIEAGAALSDGRESLWRRMVGFSDYTLLSHYTLACEMGALPEVVMEDSRRELRKHLPIWLAARGDVLVTGLGLGCVVRGLLISPHVNHVTVIEKCPRIVEVIGPEFWNDPRVSLRLDDAMEWIPDRKFDFAWHDLWTDVNAGEPHLQRLHARLFIKYRKTAKVQGAWAFPRELFRLYASRLPLIGGPKFRESATA